MADYGGDRNVAHVRERLAYGGARVNSALVDLNNADFVLVANAAVHRDNLCVGVPPLNKVNRMRKVERGNGVGKRAVYISSDVIFGCQHMPHQRSQAVANNAVAADTEDDVRAPAPQKRLEREFKI